jgi:prepilin-type processing-associated H-X9-DG protein
MHQRGMTGREFVVGMAIVLVLGTILGGILLPSRHHNREAARRASCAGNLKQFGLIFSMYSDESLGGLFPRTGYYYEPEVDCDAPGYPAVGNAVGVWTSSVNTRDLFPQYMSDPSPFVCPSGFGNVDWFFNPASGELEVTELCAQDDRGAKAAGQNYVYSNYYFGNWAHPDGERDTVNLIEISELGNLGTSCGIDADTEVNLMYGLYAYVVEKMMWDDPEGLLNLLNTDIDLEVESTQLGLENEFFEQQDRKHAYRICKGLERFLITDINGPPPEPISTVPVMYDSIEYYPQILSFNHVPGGSNILFNDGHVEFVRYPGRFPVTHGAASIEGGCFVD